MRLLKKGINNLHSSKKVDKLSWFSHPLAQAIPTSAGASMRVREIISLWDLNLLFSKKEL
jgi:hypothetical protein